MQPAFLEHGQSGKLLVTDTDVDTLKALLDCQVCPTPASVGRFKKTAMFFVIA